MPQPDSQTYFVITHSNSTFNRHTMYWEIDFPEWFTNSMNDKKIILLGFYYYGGLGEDLSNDKFSLHSPTLTDGKYQQIDHFITLSQYTVTAWSKEYRITSKAQKFQFQFRSMNEAFEPNTNPLPESRRFLIEMILIY